MAGNTISSRKERCRICYYAAKTVKTVRYAHQTKKTNPAKYVELTCHRFPPTALIEVRGSSGITSAFPIVRPDDYCAEFKSRPAPLCGPRGEIEKGDK